MENCFKLKTIAGSLLFALAAPSYALHLGEPTAKSFFGETLRVEIPVMDTPLEESKGLIARSVSYPYGKKFPGHPEFKVDLKYENDKPVLILTSSTPVYEPVFDVAIEVTWAAGRMIQPLTILVDNGQESTKPLVLSQNKPAESVPQSQVNIVKTPTVAKIELSDKSSSSRSASSSKNAQTVKSKQAVVKTEPQSYDINGYIVKNGDSLSKIARSTNPGNIPDSEWQNVIFKSNPRAFAGTPNHILSGSVLNLAAHDSNIELKNVVAKTETKHAVPKIEKELIKTASTPKGDPKLRKLNKVESELSAAEAKIKMLEDRMNELLSESRRLDSAIEDAKFDIKFKASKEQESQANTVVKPPKKDKKASKLHISSNETKGLAAVIDAYRKV